MKHRQPFIRYKYATPMSLKTQHAFAILAISLVFLAVVLAIFLVRANMPKGTILIDTSLQADK